MGIKAEKTFEEIVERLVALFRPQPVEPDDSSHAPPPPSLDTRPLDTHQQTSSTNASRPSEDETA